MAANTRLAACQPLAIASDCPIVARQDRRTYAWEIIVNVWVAVGLALGVLGIGASVYYGRRGSVSEVRGARVVVRVINAIPVYDLPDGAQEPGEHFVSVEAVNTGDEAVTITGWGVKLPGDRRIVVTRPVNWATPLPHRLEPGNAPTRFVMPADELRQVAREQAIPYDAMRPYVTLANGTDVSADRSVPLA
jgi:hypothetical protein